MLGSLIGTQLLINVLLVPVLAINLSQLFFVFLIIFSVLAYVLSLVIGPIEIAYLPEVSGNFSFSSNNQSDINQLLLWYGYVVVGYTALSFLIKKILGFQLKISLKLVIKVSMVMHLFNALVGVFFLGWEVFFIQLLMFTVSLICLGFMRALQTHQKLVQYVAMKLM
jgi:hypothetical protein